MSREPTFSAFPSLFRADFDFDTQHNRSTSSSSTATSSAAPHTPGNEAVGINSHNKEMDAVMQTKAAILPERYATSSSRPDASIRVVHPNSLLARITRSNATTGTQYEGRKFAMDCSQGFIPTSTSKVNEIKTHRGSTLARIVGGGAKPQGEEKADVSRRLLIPNVTTTKHSAPFLPNGPAIIPGYINNATIRVCQFLALIIFTTFNGTDSAPEFLDSDACSSLTAFIWRTNNSLTAQRYWIRGLKNPAVFRSIVYLLRLFPSNIPLTSVETMKHVFAFIALLGIKYNTDSRVLCTMICGGLGTPNFAVLERLALKVVEYDLLVRNGDWADCSGRLRECMRFLTAKESRDAVGAWLDEMEVLPAPHTALKRSSCRTNMDEASILLKALETPEIADSFLMTEESRMTVAKRQAVEKRVMGWIKGVDEALQESNWTAGMRVYTIL